MAEEHIYPWGDARRFNAYSSYFKKRYGGRVQKVAINAGFTCPNRDGSKGRGGCTYCNNEAFNPSYCDPAKSVRQQIEEGILFHASRYRRAHRFLAYFQAFSNTYRPLEELRRIYEEALACEGIVGIVVGTRPDCVDEAKLDYFAALSERYHVVLEYGIESCCDRTLERINRKDTFAQAEWAVRESSRRGIVTGAHFVLGLPGESREMMIAQTERINALPLDTVKFHQLQVFHGTAMAKEYAEHPERFGFFGRDEYIDFFIDILCRLRPDLVVERFAGEAPPRFHCGPSWGTIRNNELLALLEKRLEERDCWQGCLYKP